MKLFDKKVYIERRKKLREKMDGGLVLFLGNSYVPYNYQSNVYKFRQDSSFLYYFGLNMPDYAGVIDLDEGKDIIFANDLTIEDIIWMGEQPEVKHLAAKVGVEHNQSLDSLKDYITKAKSLGRKIHFLPAYRSKNKWFLQDLLGISDDPNNHTSERLVKAVIDMRLIKQKEEIEYLDSIMDVAYEMHTLAMKSVREGIYEREIVGAMEGLVAGYGGDVSFPIILSKDGQILHNEYHENKLKNGDLLLVDAGFDSPMGYATDNTRTFPVSGKYTDKQREIYEIVVAANDAVHEASKPGVMYRDMHLLACKVIAENLTDLGIMKGNVDDAVKAGAHALFMPHGLGHAMGLDVHDMEGLCENLVGYGDELERSEQFGTAYLRFARKLKPGHVVTNEPGIYFIPALIDKWKAEGINKEFINFDKLEEYRDFGGVRLEDDMLITDNGSRNLGEKRIPIYVDEVEAMIRRNL